MTDLVDFLDPSGGRAGVFFPLLDDMFSLLSSDPPKSLLTIGEAGIVLNLFFSPTALGAGFLGMEEARGRDRAVVGCRVVIGVAGAFWAPVGLDVL
jgi:hypothetical protein